MFEGGLGLYASRMTSPKVSQHLLTAQSRSRMAAVFIACSGKNLRRCLSQGLPAIVVESENLLQVDRIPSLDTITLILTCSFLIGCDLLAILETV